MRTKAGAVHSRDLRRRKSAITSRGRVRSTALALDGVTRAEGAVQTQILNDAVAQGGSRNGLQLTHRFGVAIAFKIQEKKEAILSDGPAQGDAEDVAVKLRRLIGSATFQLSSLDEIIVGADVGIAVVFVDRAVEGVGAAFGD